MEFVVKKTKNGEDTSNIEYWRTLTYKQRLNNLVKIRKEVIRKKYGTDPGFQRVIRVIQKKRD